VPDSVVTTLTEAVDDWNSEPPGAVGVIALLDNRSYAEDLAITMPTGSELLVIAVTWPAAEDASNPTVTLSLDQASPDDRRPHLLGSITVTGSSGVADGASGELTLDGLLVEGALEVTPGDLGRLCIRHCTQVPSSGSVSVASPTTNDDDNGRLLVELDRSIVGPVAFSEQGPRLTATYSIVDGASGVAVSAAAASVALNTATILGDLSARQLDASDSLLTGAVAVERRQVGCLRFSYVREGAVAPRRFRCQPDLALADVDDPQQAALVRSRLTPVFSSTSYGDPAYGRLDDRTDPALSTGSSTGAAMGAFSDLAEPQRMTNLAAVLEEYLRLGLEAGVIHET
jgi:hypothetical protein